MFVAGLEYSYYIVANKNGQKFHMRGYENEEKI